MRWLYQNCYSPLFLLSWSISLTIHSQATTQDTVSEETDFKVLFSAFDLGDAGCYRIPALITATNGDLIAAIDERVTSCGDLKWNRDINVVIRRSTDDGTTWSAVERIVDYPDGQSASDASMIVDEVTGEIFLFFNFMDHDAEKNVYYFKVIRSADHGRSWSRPVDITHQISKSTWHNDFKFITSGRGIQTRTGRLLHTFVNLDRGLFLFASDDHGQSWFLMDTPVVPGDESKVVELPDGSWMINSRVNGAGNRYIHTSDDGGKSWLSRPDSSLIDPGCNASLLKHRVMMDDKPKYCLLFSNAKSSVSRQNMTIRMSCDNGNTWSLGRTIYSGSAAYSSMTVLANGDVGLFFEKDDYRENVFVRIKP